MSTQDERVWYADPWTPGDRFRKAREHTGLDQHEFAALIGASRQTISNYETDSRDRRSRTIVLAWAMVTGVSAEWLTEGTLPGGHDDGPNGTAAPKNGNGRSTVAGAGFEPATSGLHARVIPLPAQMPLAA